MKDLSIWRKKVTNVPACVFLAQESRVHEFFCVFGYGFEIAVKPVSDIFERNPLLLRHQPQDLYPPVIGNAFEMAF